MTGLWIAIGAALSLGLLATPVEIAAQPPPPYHQGGGVEQGSAPPAPYGRGQWPGVQQRPRNPPPARFETVPRGRRGYYWVPGHYAWRGSWRWIPGAWIPRRPGCGWVPPHWQWYPYGWVWLEGYWAC
jgi:hypothetical protein